MSIETETARFIERSDEDLSVTCDDHVVFKNIMAQASSSQAVQRLQNLIGATWRISIQDKRIFIGTLVCTDKEKNIILVNADEYKPAESREGRYVGMIMIPWRWIVKAEVEWSAYANAEVIDEEGLYT